MEKTIQKFNFIEEATSIGAAIAGGLVVGIVKTSYEKLVDVFKMLAENPSEIK